MTISVDVRGALQARLNTVSGLPQVAYENFPFEITRDTDGDVDAYVAVVVVPGTERPFDVGSSALVHIGSLEMVLRYPAGAGTGTIEAMADAIKAVFVPGTRLTLGSANVRIRWAERRQAIIDPQFIHLPVSVGFRAT